MDTRLKKFNADILKKTIAFVLCLLCAAGAMSQVLSSILAYDESDLQEHHMYDALNYGGKRLGKKDITETRSFKYNVSNYSEALLHTFGTYGDGSEKAYEEWKKGLEEYNKQVRESAVANLIDHVIHDDFFTYLQLLDKGAVEPLDVLEEFGDSGEHYSYEADSIYDYGVDYYNIFCNSARKSTFVNIPAEVQKKAAELGADGVFEVRNTHDVEEYRYGDFVTIASYKPGYYAFKVNEAAVEDMIVKYSIIQRDNFGSAEEFTRAFKMREKDITEKYASGRYFIMDSSGRVFTNIEGLNEKSSVEDVKNAFSKLDFYCFDEGDYNLVTEDGKFYAFGGMGRYNESDYRVPVVTTVYYGTTTTLPPSPTSVTETSTTMASTDTDDEENTVTSATELSVTMPVTTRHLVAVRDETPFISERGTGNLYYIGVDMSASDDAASDIIYDDFLKTAAQIERAKELVTDVLFTCSLLGTIFLICFIYLIARAGKRKGFEEIQLMKGDRMFTELRIALDGALGYGTFMLTFGVLEYAVDNQAPAGIILLWSLVCTVFAALVIDLVLFITRHIRNKSLLKQLFPVWLYKKCKAYYDSKLRTRINERFSFVRDFSIGTILAIVVFVLVNVVAGFCAVMESYNNDTFLIAILLAIFDIFVLLWVLRYIGGLRQIFKALDEIKGGNYNVQLNLFALPTPLRETANKVMSLRDGLKSAVEEAVKQEQTKTELITNVSHDLKTPLTSIINYVELLKKCEIKDEDAKEYLMVLGEKSDRLKKLIEDLVEASKASTGNIRVDFMSVSLNEMVSQLLGEHADGLERKKLNVIADIPEKELTVRSDGKLLYRVMENLIVNIEKYSLYGTRVYVTVKEEGDYCTVSFKNISEQPLNITADQLKERFVRGDEARSTEGNGLGLSIAQSLCQVQGGELEIVINGDLFTAKVKLNKD